MSDRTAPAPVSTSIDMEVRGTPPGSMRYFSVLFATAEQRPWLQALYAFEAEIRDTIDAQSHEAAHARLQWWRTEVDRTVGGRPQHPITTALLPVRLCASGDLSLLHESLSAADLDLAHMTYASAQELEAYCFRSAGALQTLVAAALAGPRELSAAERTFARKLGSALRQTELLRDFGTDLRRGRLHAPLDLFTSAGIEPDSLNGVPSASVAGALEPWRTRAITDLGTLSSGLTKHERRAQRPGLVLAALHQRLLARVNPTATGAGARAELPPFARLWTAWSTAIRHA
jgi:15-cis-phytoene synthase